ncbi:tyrosine-type recombinase/integrase [Halomonas sp. HK25]|uniref:tyrosine-type recombinase/integrase n=1 Tax=Halomonas sp. HK25 TaxID=3394321 RepID=UPI0039FD5FA4
MCKQGLRISELIGLCANDLHLGTGAHVVCHGKGRKERITPLTPATVKLVRDWLAEQQMGPDSPVFPTRRGTPLSRDAIEHRLKVYIPVASRTSPTLVGKRVTAHTIRHTAAMRLLEAGVDTSVIALWLVMSRSRPRPSTCMPIWRSRNALWRSPNTADATQPISPARYVACLP